MRNHILNIDQFYSQVAKFKAEIDPNWDRKTLKHKIDKEYKIFSNILKNQKKETILDCSCGIGEQAIPLAKLGYKVKASDITDKYLEIAITNAEEAQVDISFQKSDMQHLEKCFDNKFDMVVTCGAIDQMDEDNGILTSLKSIYGVLKDSGILFIRTRNFDQLLKEKPRYEVKEEFVNERYRVIWLQDWDFTNKENIICTWIFLKQDKGQKGYNWETNIFSFKRKALLKVTLNKLLLQAGFKNIRYLNQDNPWAPHEILADKQ